MEKKKILQILPDYESAFSIKICNHYTAFFDESEFEVTTLYLAGAFSRKVEQRTDSQKVLFWELTAKQQMRLRWRYVRWLSKLIKMEKYHLVICHRYEAIRLAAFLSIYRSGLNIVGVVHEEGEFADKARRRLLSWCSKKLYLIAITNVVRNDILDSLPKFPEERVLTIYLSPNYKKLKGNWLSKNEARIELGLEPFDYVFVAVEELRPDKNLKYLIQAFSLAGVVLNDAKLVIIGSGAPETERELKILAQDLLIDDCVIFKNNISEPAKFYKAFNVFVSCSDDDNYNMKLLEAMASGLPVIAASGKGCAKEIVADAGYSYKQKDVYQLVHFLEQIYQLDEGDMKAMIKKSYDRLNHHFRTKSCRSKFWSYPFTERLLSKLSRSGL